MLGVVAGGVVEKVGWSTFGPVLGLVVVLFILVHITSNRLIARVVSAYIRAESQRVSGGFDWLYTKDQLLIYEEETGAAEIWLISADLLDDVGEGAFREAVRNNLARGMRYRFFVPDTVVLRSRATELMQSHSHPNVRCVFLRDEFFFLVPKLDIVIYNPQRAGVEKRTAFLGIPAAGEEKHYSAKISDDLTDAIIGMLLPYCSR